jgi:2-haloacid dehalogenase
MGDAIEGTVAIARALKSRGTRLYGLTNWSSETFPFAREKFAFIAWFDGIIVSGDVGVRKPSPAIFTHLFDRYDLKPADAVFIDDHPPNIEAARSLGLESHLFASPEGLRRYLTAVGLL